MLLQTILEGLGLGALLVAVCAVGIRKGAVGMVPECQPDAEVACWYGQREGHMKKAVEKLRKIYPKLTVRCFPDFGHGDILNHPALLAEKLKNELI